MSGRTGGGERRRRLRRILREQGAANDTSQRAEEEDIREGEASDEERGDQDGLQLGFMSPQVQRRASNGRAKRQPAPRGATLSRHTRSIGRVDPLRWSRGSKELSGTPKRKRPSRGQQKRAKQDLTARLAASLSANSRATQRDGEASAAGSMDLNEREWESADGSGSGDGSDGDSQRSVAQKTSRGKRHRVVQLDPLQRKDDQLRDVISSRMSARPNWQRLGDFASLM